jgi:hypothetical protein
MVLNRIKHPSGILGEKQIENIQKQHYLLKNASGVVLDGYKPRVIQCVNIGPYGSGVGHEEFVGDCMQAYLQVLVWIATRDPKFAQKSKEIILEWCCKCKTFEGANAPLECAWGTPLLVRTVELLKYVDGGEWNEHSNRLFNTFLDKIILPNLKGRYIEIKKWKNNWIFSLMEALLSIYMLRNDVAGVVQIVEHYKSLLKECIQPCGCNTENRRDMTHCQFQMASQIQIAEMLWHQGVDVYDDIIMKTMEYQARILLGEVPPELKKEDIKENKFMPSSWEVGYNHFAGRKKENMPYTLALLKKKRPEARMSFNWGPGMLHKDTS